MKKFEGTKGKWLYTKLVYEKQEGMNEKALTVKQPYAYLQCVGIKDIENRTWKTKHRGRVFIHASAKAIIPITNALTAKQFNYLCEIHELRSVQNTTSAIIGYVDIIDCVENHSSIWALPNHYHWVLANPVLFDKPILDVKGKLSFWDCSKYIHSEIDEDSNPYVWVYDYELTDKPKEDAIKCNIGYTYKC
jgi:hypothetical protein